MNIDLERRGIARAIVQGVAIGAALAAPIVWLKFGPASGHALAFLASGKPGLPFAILTHAVIAPLRAPEAAGWALMGLGFAGLAYAGRGRRNPSAVAL